MLEFFIAALVIGIAPGPDNLFVLAQSATYGARLGFCIILGLCTGIALQICLLVLGVSALIAASSALLPLLFPHDAIAMTAATMAILNNTFFIIF